MNVKKHCNLAWDKIHLCKLKIGFQSFENNCCCGRRRNGKKKFGHVLKHTLLNGNIMSLKVQGIVEFLIAE